MPEGVAVTQLTRYRRSFRLVLDACFLLLIGDGGMPVARLDCRMGREEPSKDALPPIMLMDRK